MNRYARCIQNRIIRGQHQLPADRTLNVRTAILLWSKTTKPFRQTEQYIHNKMISLCAHRCMLKVMTQHKTTDHTESRPHVPVRVQAGADVDVCAQRSCITVLSWPQFSEWTTGDEERRVVSHMQVPSLIRSRRTHTALFVMRIFRHSHQLASYSEFCGRELMQVRSGLTLVKIWCFLCVFFEPEENAYWCHRRNYSERAVRELSII